ncbi:hypothetical protein G4B88_010744 [Cannabis sativa]|uniref:DUF4283 domain-containing protein n=1 Tax=Cannabis sativa TaxID=3483 RepID=A0A7J6F9V6_CANSA|nr:hypothetical protein G4B88_010744 [Cannabis sativa]
MGKNSGFLFMVNPSSPSKHVSASVSAALSQVFTSPICVPKVLLLRFLITLSDWWSSSTAFSKSSTQSDTAALKYCAVSLASLRVTETPALAQRTGLSLAALENGAKVRMQRLRYLVTLQALRTYLSPRLLFAVAKMAVLYIMSKIMKTEYGLAIFNKYTEGMENTEGVVRLDEEEEEVLKLPVSRTEEIVIDTRWCLVGKLLTGRVSDFNVFQNMMAFLWQPGMGMYVKELNPNLFLFQFYHEIDIQRVIDGSPWTYDRKPLIFTRLKEGDNPRLVEINHMDMWVQLHNLQPGNMTLSRRHSTFGAQWLRSGAAVRGESSQASHGGSGERGVNLSPGIQEQLVGSAGNIMGYDINNNWPNERHQYGDKIMGVNEEDLTLNVNNNGNFFDSTITTITDSKRRRPDSNVGVSMGPQATVNAGLENFTVNSLFQAHNRCWDSDVVKDFFSPSDAAIILGIPIDQTGAADSCK